MPSVCHTSSHIALNSKEKQFVSLDSLMEANTLDQPAEKEDNGTDSAEEDGSEEEMWESNGVGD